MSDKTKETKLTRDCDVVQIPSGDKSVLPAGTDVYISQDLGGTYTVQTLKGLFRIDGKDADALGRGSQGAGEEGGAPREATEGAFSEKTVWEALRSCFDPEIPVNIVDLGLIYDLKFEALENGQHRVNVRMTLTAPGCGMGPVIADDAQQKILMAPGVSDATVEIVWDPPWHQSMITPEGRKVLGL
ncbi:MAG: putative Fe-S cluster assembly protein SufT [Verrucomicrobia bacterium]|jgi:probable FeS assembly SUF system protein SufT|nr:putative Fe-S cluster assembly protein SufT [Verrucomicrobiota bacterium]